MRGKKNGSIVGNDIGVTKEGNKTQFLD